MAEDSEQLWAIVPARGGSKDVPEKNLADVGGASLVCRAIASALAARAVARVVVSTDSEAIREAALACGAEAPFTRPAELARDDTPGIEPIRHALEWFRASEGRVPAWVVCLQPTSPFRTGADVDAAFRIALDTGADAVISVARASCHPYWARSVDVDGLMRPFLSERESPVRRQDLPDAFMLNGAIYLARASVLERGSFYGERTVAYVMPEERSLDVDSAWDLRVARALATEEAAS
ncbi:MAG: acylneuraminate cytidylyltransferase family protein [Gemmatimonadota bacterium]